MRAVMAFGEDLVAARRRGPDRLAKAAQAGQEARESFWFQVDNKSEHGIETEKEFPKLNEPCGNVYENKGSVFHRSARSWNLIENKGGYPLKARMLLKKDILAVSLQSPRLPRIAVTRPVPSLCSVLTKNLRNGPNMQEEQKKNS